MFLLKNGGPPQFSYEQNQQVGRKRCRERGAPTKPELIAYARWGAAA